MPFDLNQRSFVMLENLISKSYEERCPCIVAVLSRNECPDASREVTRNNDFSCNIGHGA